jgi:hypothetical protein
MSDPRPEICTSQARITQRFTTQYGVNHRCGEGIARTHCIHNIDFWSLPRDGGFGWGPRHTTMLTAGDHTRAQRKGLSQLGA